MRFFVDNNLSYRIAHAIGTLQESEGHEVVALRDKFDENAEDEAWLPLLRADGDWVVITSDLGKRSGNRQVWLNSGLTVFFLTPAWTQGGFKNIDIAQRLMKYWGEIASTAEKCHRGSCFDLGIHGTINKARRR